MVAAAWKDLYNSTGSVVIFTRLSCPQADYLSPFLLQALPLLSVRTFQHESVAWVASSSHCVFTYLFIYLMPPGSDCTLDFTKSKKSVSWPLSVWTGLRSTEKPICQPLASSCFENRARVWRHGLLPSLWPVFAYLLWFSVIAGIKSVKHAGRTLRTFQRQWTKTTALKLINLDKLI